MDENPNTTKRIQPKRNPRRWYQFGLRTLLVGVTLTGLLAGAIRWLIILFGVEIAGAIVIGLWFAASYGASAEPAYRFGSYGVDSSPIATRPREIESTRILLELDEVREAIRAANSLLKKGTGSE